MRRWTTTLAALAVLAPALVTGCTSSSTAATAGPSTAVTVATTAPVAASSLTTSSVPASPASTPSAERTPPAASSAATATTAKALTAAAPLRGKVVVIDPGHNGGNGSHPSQINRLVNIGNGRKACDTSGTQTNGGYAEAAFTWDVSNRLAALLRAAGATVVLTRPNNSGVGPCITERAAIGNRARADAAISIHGDGAAAAGYGFHVIAPGSIGRNAAIVAPSGRLAVAVRTAFAAGAKEPFSTYTGGGRAMTVRTDLGGLNLSSVPKIFIECGNMRNAADAQRMTSPVWRQRAAQALATGLTTFLTAP